MDVYGSRGYRWDQHWIVSKHLFDLFFFELNCTILYTRLITFSVTLFLKQTECVFCRFEFFV